MKSKKVVIISDLHVGSRAGLTTSPLNPLQTELLTKYEENVKLWKSPDVLIVNGDMVDGSRKDITRTEHDVSVQAKMALDLLKMWGAKKYFLTYGTPWHVTSKQDGVDYENYICDLLNTWKPRCAHIRDYYDNLDINGVIFNVKHKVGSSSIPHGRATALAKAVMWNFWGTIVGHRIKGDIFIRSHTHYYQALEMNTVEAITTPAWQGADTVFGNRICESDIDVGSIMYIVNGREKGWERKINLVFLEEAKPLLFKG